MHGAIPLSSLSVSMTCCTNTVCFGHPMWGEGRCGLPGIWTTEGKLCGVGNVQQSLLRAESMTH